MLVAYFPTLPGAELPASAGHFDDAWISIFTLAAGQNIRVPPVVLGIINIRSAC